MTESRGKSSCDGRTLFPFITQILCMSLGLVAFIMSSEAASGCSYVTPLSGVDDNGNVNECYEQLGLFSARGGEKTQAAGSTTTCVYSQCIKYESGFMATFEGDTGSIQPAQAMGAIAATFGGILWLGCMFMLFFRFPMWLFKTIGGVYLFCFLAQMLTLLMLNNPTCKGTLYDSRKLSDDGYNCALGPDGATAIVSALFYLGLGITVSICPVPKTAVITCIDCIGCCEDGCGDEEEGCICCCGEETSTGAVETTTRTKRRQINTLSDQSTTSNSSKVHSLEEGLERIKNQSKSASRNGTSSVRSNRSNSASVRSNRSNSASVRSNRSNSASVRSNRSSASASLRSNKSSESHHSGSNHSSASKSAKSQQGNGTMSKSQYSGIKKQLSTVKESDSAELGVQDKDELYVYCEGSDLD